ncbi:MAG: restriction endonuclease subunit S, partial [Candidatus Omnitrophota bacterium]
HRFIIQPSVLQGAIAHFSGAVGQQRVPETYLANLSISLPPLTEQKRIAAILTKQMAALEKAWAAIEEQLEAAEALPSASSHEIFNSPEAKKWPRKRLGDYVTKVGSGITPLGGYASYQKTGIPLIRSQNIRMNTFEPEGLAFISEVQDAEMGGSRVIPKDVLLNITGASIGRVCVVPDKICPANVNQHVSIIRGNGTFEPAFLSYYLSTPDFQKIIMDSQAGATRQALTKTLIENFIIPLPPFPVQKRISAELAGKISAAEKLACNLREQLETINKMPAALLRKTFNGEL